MSGYRAVLFDWMLTLAEYPDEREHVRRADKVLGRGLDAEALDEIVGRLAVAAVDRDVIALMDRADCSADLHREATMLLFERADIDDELAVAMYQLIGDPSFHPLYPEVAEVLRRLVDRGVRIAVISDIHVDLRPHARAFGIEAHIDVWTLSFEHGIQKPDPAIFQLALDELGVSADQALMVGDRASHDGAAARLGIDTLIVPNRARTTTDRSDRLEVVLRAVGV